MPERSGAPSSPSPTYAPAEHYDAVTAAWQLLLGEELHYGVFEHADDDLPRATAELTRRMIAAANPRPGERVLDVGCGTGAPAVRLADELGVEVVGITTSAVGVEAARRRATGRSDVTFEQRDGTSNGFADAAFDIVWVLESAHLMRDRDALLDECARVLRPNGRLVLCDIVRHREIPFTEVRDRRAEFTVLRTAFGDAHFQPLDWYADAARGRGLVVTDAVDLTHETLPTFARWRANARAHGDEVRALIGDDGLHAFARSCDILEAFWRDGTFGYGLLAASRPA